MGNQALQTSHGTKIKVSFIKCSAWGAYIKNLSHQLSFNNLKIINSNRLHLLTPLLSSRLKRSSLNAIQDDEVSGKSEVHEGFWSRILLLQESIFCSILLPLSSALWNWDQETKGCEKWQEPTLSWQQIQVHLGGLQAHLLCLFILLTADPRRLTTVSF